MGYKWQGRTQFQKNWYVNLLLVKVKNDKGQRTQVVSNLSVHPYESWLLVQVVDLYKSGIVMEWVLMLIDQQVLNGGDKGASNGERIASRSDSDDTVLNIRHRHYWQYVGLPALNVQVLYDPILSNKGALLPASQYT